MDPETNTLLEFGGCRLDPVRKILWHEDRPVALPLKLAELLCLLVLNEGQIVTRDEIWKALWTDTFVEESTLAHNIYLLRKTLNELGETNLIQTIPRRGYRFTGDVHAASFGDLVIERRTYSHTRIEVEDRSEVEESFAGPGSGPRQRRSFLYRAAFAAFGILALIIGGFLALRTFSTAPSSHSYGSVAILPFKNLSAENSDGRISMGLTDALITRLGAFRNLEVRPLSAVEAFSESGKDSVTFAKDLKVDAFIEGTIQSNETSLRVNLRLVDTSSGIQIWADSFDESPDDVLKLQDRISGKVSRLLVPKFRQNDASELAQGPTDNPVAYQFYLAGRERWMRRDGKADSLPFFRKAIEQDPNFALAYLGIADQIAFSDNTREAEVALGKAIELDPSLADAYATRGFLQMFHHWDWEAAGKSFRRALELAPNSSKGHHWYGVYLSLTGRLDEALGEMERARDLDPTSPVIMTDIAELHYFRRDYDRAEQELEKVLQLDPSFRTARQHLVKVHYKKGASYFEEFAKFSISEAMRTRAEGVVAGEDVAYLERYLSRGDDKGLTDHMVRASLQKATVSGIENWPLAIMYVVAGRKEESLDALEKVSRLKPFMLPFIAVDPIWDGVRKDPRFSRILSEMKLRTPANT